MYKVNLNLDKSEIETLSEVMGKTPVYVVANISKKYKLENNFGITNDDIIKSYLTILGYLKYGVKDFELEEYGAKVFTTWLGCQRYEDSIYIKEHIETKYTEDDIEDVLMHLYKEVADAVGDEDLLIWLCFK